MADSKPRQLRIISGLLKGRKIQFPNVAAIRPTPDRVRETLFNWIALDLPGSYCLDLFAGSGAIGFEALSRGAAEVTFVDQSNEVIQHLHQYLKKFNCTNANVIHADSLQPIAVPKNPFDFVFLDPPFGKDFLEPVANWLNDAKYLAANANIYIESEQEINTYNLPKQWKILKNLVAGNVHYSLLVNEK